VLVAIGNLFFNYFFYNKKLSRFWGSQSILSKKNFLVKNETEFNTLFVGSSKTKYQVDPVLFDSIINTSTNQDIHSFNIGIESMTPPESFYFYEMLLRDESIHLKNVIIELDFFRNDDTENLFNWRSYYWMTPANYKLYTSSVLHSHYALYIKAKYLTILNLMAATKIYNLGKFNEYVQFKKNEFLIDSSFVGRNGFIGLPHPKSFNASLLSKMEDVKNASITAFSKFDEWSAGKKNQTFFNSIEQLRELSAKRNINLIFLVPIQWTSAQYRELFPVLKTIPDKNKIIIADYNKFKPLFDINIAYDHAHFDSVGAKIYTRYLADAFVKLK
jgi:hypothetical protein